VGGVLLSFLLTALPPHFPLEKRRLSSFSSHLVPSRLGRAEKSALIRKRSKEEKWRGICRGEEEGKNLLHFVLLLLCWPLLQICHQKEAAGSSAKKGQRVLFHPFCEEKT